LPILATVFDEAEGETLTDDVDRFRRFEFESKLSLPPTAFRTCLNQDKIARLPENALANARIIAAAPDLLSALENLMARCVKDAEHYAADGNEAIWAYISDASDAIAKAKGEAP
jgi:hypothetical protein